MLLCTNGRGNVLSISMYCRWNRENEDVARARLETSFAKEFDELHG